MGIFGNRFKKPLHIQVMAPKYTSSFGTPFEFWVDPDVFKKMDYLVHDNYVYRIDRIIALDKAQDDFDAIVYVTFVAAYNKFFDDAKYGMV